MASPHQKILLTCARDTVLALTIFYLTLLVLDALIGGFVAAFIPLGALGYCTLAALGLYAFYKRRSR